MNAAQTSFANTEKEICLKYLKIKYEGEFMNQGNKERSI